MKTDPTNAPKFNCILTRDSFNQYLIDVAIQVGLKLNDGMEDVAEERVSVQQCHMLYLAAQYGLQWNNYMKELAELNADEVQNRFDLITCLRPFILAVAGAPCCILKSICGVVSRMKYMMDES